MCCNSRPPARRQRHCYPMSGIVLKSRPMPRLQQWWMASRPKTVASAPYAIQRQSKEPETDEASIDIDNEAKRALENTIPEGPTSKPDTCSPEQRGDIDAAFKFAVNWLDSAIGGLELQARFANSPQFAITADPDLAQALTRHFHVGILSPYATKVQQNLRLMRSGLSKSWHRDCPDRCSGEDAAADSGTGTVRFCKPFFDNSPENRAQTLLHEAAHLFAESTTARNETIKATDRALHFTRHLFTSDSGRGRQQRGFLCNFCPGSRFAPAS